MNNHPSQYRVILWDFDGVIIDSNEVREYGFREVLKDYPEAQVDELINYHNQNGGLSRYVKFRYFFKEIRGEEISTDKVNQLAKDFSEIMLIKLPNKDYLITQTVEFIRKRHASGIEHHIVSGSDQEELEILCQKLRIKKYFSTIQGSPTPKTELVEGVLKMHAQKPNAFCLIGDSINDYEAAEENGIDFFGFNNKYLKLISEKYLDGFETI